MSIPEQIVSSGDFTLGAPTPTPTPSPTPSSGTLSWNSTSNLGPLGGVTFEVFGPSGFDLTFTDDDANDANPTPGVLALAGLQLNANYTVCEMVTPSGYERLNGCQSLFLNGATGGGFTFGHTATTAATFTVTTADDLHDFGCFATCSLHQAMLAADDNGNVRDTIVFAIPPGQSKDIVLTDVLPVIGDSVTIDGLTEPGIRIIGTSAGSAINGLELYPGASGSIIRGLDISGFPGSGIFLRQTHDVVVGGTGPGEGNRIADNGNDGITLVGDSTDSGNQFLGNRIVGNADASIDLNDDGGPHGVGGHIGDAPGPNHLQNAPIIGAPSGFPVTSVTVGVSARSSFATRVEIFWSSTCDLNTLIAPAQEFVGSINLTALAPLATPDPPVSFQFASPLRGGYLTGTATTPDGTSELSTCVPVVDTTKFITRSGTQLLDDAQPFRPVGLNIYNANSNGWCWYQMNGTILDDSLTAIGPGENVLRAWFFQPLATTNGVRDWTAFDRTLATARAHGYRVIATLIDQWGDCGVSTVNGYGYKDLNWYQNAYKQTDTAGTVSYRDWAQEVASRYKTDPTVLAWQLVNEPEVGDCNVTPESTATAALKSFATDVSGAVKAVDPNHLISLGTIGSGQCGAQGGDFHDVMTVPTLDLCEFHDYNPNALVPGDAFNGLPQRINQCNSLGKPLIVGEMGVRPIDVAGTLADRAKVVGDKVCAQFTAGVAGVLLWAWDKDGSLLDNYDIGPGDPLLGVLAPWSDPSHTCAATAVPSGPRHVVAGGSRVGLGELDRAGVQSAAADHCRTP